MSAVTIRDFHAEWETATYARRRGRWVKHDLTRLRAFLDWIPPNVVYIPEVTARLVSAFLAEGRLQKGWSPTTVIRYRQEIHAFLEQAVRFELIDRNPAKLVPRPKLPRRQITFLTVQQIGQLLEVLEGDPLRPLVATCLYAGLRRSEAVWLTWADLELGDEPRLHVRAKTVEGESWVPKTGDDRTVPISQRLMALLLQVPRVNQTWVFASPRGGRWHEDSITHRLRRVLRAAKLPWRLMDCRHTAGSQWVQRGVPLLSVSKLLGNSYQVAERFYCHLQPNRMRSEVEY
jgi:integrase